MKWSPIVGLAAGVLVLVGACAGADVPSDQLTQTRSAISAAEAVDGQYPQAALHLRMARMQFEGATKMIEDRDYERAERLLERAESDAELAQVLARQAMVRQQAERARREVAQLRAEIEGAQIEAEGETR